MKYSKEERLEIGCQVYTGGLNKYEAAEKYDNKLLFAHDQSS